MGGIDKPGLLVDGVSMRDRAIAAVTSAGAVAVVVGPAPEAETAGSPAVGWVREDPPFSGPAAAIVTGLTALGPDAAEWTFLLACDLPHPELAVARLLRGVGDLPPQSDGACLGDDAGRAQWLAGIYRMTALADAAAALPDGGRDLPVRVLVAGLSVEVFTDPDAGARDVDTWEDYEELTKEHP